MRFAPPWQPSVSTATRYLRLQSTTLSTRPLSNKSRPPCPSLPQPQKPVSAAVSAAHIPEPTTTLPPPYYELPPPPPTIAEPKQLRQNSTSRRLTSADVALPRRPPASLMAYPTQLLLLAPSCRPPTLTAGSHWQHQLPVGPSVSGFVSPINRRQIPRGTDFSHSPVPPPSCCSSPQTSSSQPRPSLCYDLPLSLSGSFRHSSDVDGSLPPGSGIVRGPLQWYDVLLQVVTYRHVRAGKRNNNLHLDISQHLYFRRGDPDLKVCQTHAPRQA